MALLYEVQAGPSLYCPVSSFPHELEAAKGGAHRLAMNSFVGVPTFVKYFDVFCLD